MLLLINQYTPIGRLDKRFEKLNSWSITRFSLDPCCKGNASFLSPARGKELA